MNSKIFFAKKILLPNILATFFVGQNKLGKTKIRLTYFQAFHKPTKFIWPTGHVTCVGQWEAWKKLNLERGQYMSTLQLPDWNVDSVKSVLKQMVDKILVNRSSCSRTSINSKKKHSPKKWMVKNPIYFSNSSYFWTN